MPQCPGCPEYHELARAHDALKAQHDARVREVLDIAIRLSVENEKLREAVSGNQPTHATKAFEGSLRDTQKERLLFLLKQLNGDGKP